MLSIIKAYQSETSSQNSTSYNSLSCCTWVICLHRDLEGGKDVNYRKFIGSNIVIFCYKEFKKLALCKSVSQLETTFNVYSEPVKSSHVKISFS